MNNPKYQWTEERRAQANNVFRKGLAVASQKLAANNRLLHLRYPDIVADPDRQVRRISDFLVSMFGDGPWQDSGNIEDAIASIDPGKDHSYGKTESHAVLDGPDAIRVEGRD